MITNILNKKYNLAYQWPIIDGGLIIVVVSENYVFS